MFVQMLSSFLIITAINKVHCASAATATTTTTDDRLMQTTIFHVFTIVVWSRSMYPKWTRPAHIRIAIVHHHHWRRRRRCRSVSWSFIYRSRYDLRTRQNPISPQFNDIADKKYYKKLNLHTLSSSRLENSSTWSSSSLTMEKKFLKVSGNDAGNWPDLVSILSLVATSSSRMRCWKKKILTFSFSSCVDNEIRCACAEKKNGITQTTTLNVYFKRNKYVNLKCVRDNNHNDDDDDDGILCKKKPSHQIFACEQVKHCEREHVLIPYVLYAHRRWWANNNKQKNMRADEVWSHTGHLYLCEKI